MTQHRAARRNQAKSGQGAVCAPQMTVRAAASLSRAALLASVSAIALLTAQMPVLASDILRGNAVASPVANVTAAQSAAMQQAQAAALQAQNSLARAVQSLQGMQAAQVAARNLANAAASTVANGLAIGGLVPDSGIPAANSVPGSWQNVSSISQSTSGGQTTVEIKQSASQAILNWQTFNVGKETTVDFNQQGNSSWVALNRVLDPSGSPSQILGRIKADGQVYLINQNGIIFGGSSQINVGSLVASALPINDALVKAGTLFSNPDRQFTFSAYSQSGGTEGPTDAFAPAAATAASQTSAVIVEAGAVISTPLSDSHNGGRVVLIGPTVSNAGSISTPDGQTILAAGQQVVLLPHYLSSDASLRGLDAFVGSILAPQIGSSTAASATVTGAVANSGIIEVDRGNITMVGGSVSQNGALISTTSVSLNGRIDLSASYNATPYSSLLTFLPSATGTVSFGSGSLTEILPELSSADRVIGTSLTLASQVNVTGNVVYIGGEILSPSGKVTVNSGSQIYVDADAIIDVAGSVGVRASVEENIVAVQLLGAQLADSSLQRTGVLRGQTIYVDISQKGQNADGTTWVGTPLADASGYAALIQRTVGELTISGGSIVLNAASSVVLQKGSLLNVSGGYIDYQGAMVQTTTLSSGGHFYDISKATPDLVYDGIAGQFVETHSSWGVTEIYSSPLLNGRTYQSGYIQGGAGGSISIQAPTAAIDGKLLGLTVTGERQRSTQPAPSSLSLVFQVPLSVGFPNVTPNIAFKDGVSQTAAAFNPSVLGLDPSATVYLSPSIVSTDGFGSLTVNTSNGSIAVLSPLVAGPGAANKISLTAANIDVEANIVVPGGSINLSVLAVDPNQTAAVIGAVARLATNVTGRGLLRLGSDASLSVAGSIVDDRATSATAYTAPLVVNGGSVSLSAFYLDLESGSRIDASGGIAVSSAGKQTAGSGGSIAISGATDSYVSPAVTGQLNLSAELTAYGVGTTGNGGSLSITAPLIQIGGATAPSGTFLLSPDFFDHGGFSSFTLAGIGRGGLVSPTPGLTVAADTIIAPKVHSYAATQTPEGALSLSPTLLPEVMRAPVALNFVAAGFSDPTSNGKIVRGDVVMAHGASITVAATSRGAGSVAFSGDTVAISGSVVAPGGAISVGAGTIGGASSVTIDLAPDSLLSAAGTWLPTLDSFGNVVGKVLAGGSITVSGNILAEKGAVIDVRGASGTIEIASALALGGPRLTAVVVDSNGGSITLKGGPELVTLATLLGGAGGPNALGGKLFVSSGPLLSTSSELIVTQVAPTTFTYQSGALAIGNIITSQGYFAAADFAAGGFDFLTLGGIVRFSGPDPVTIHANGSLTVASSGLLVADTSVVLSAPYVAIGQVSAAPVPSTQGIAGPVVSTTIGNVAVSPSFGSASLSINASTLIDIGSIALQGIGLTSLVTAGDVRGNGTFEASGAISVTAGQVYPTTEGMFTIAAFDSTAVAGSVTFNRASGTLPQLPLSAGGVLNVFASSITQDGVLRAPIGTINLGSTVSQTTTTAQNLNTTTSVTLGSDSITSVSAVDPVTGQALVLPYGTMLNGANWIDPTGTDISSGGLPGKTVNIAGANVNVSSGAVIDLKGGGDLYAYNWVSGLGGTKDILATSNSFAIVPGYQSLVAPVVSVTKQNNDGSTSGVAGWSSSLAVGDQITLAASTNGLPAGTYTLLPARYALLSGAFLITAVKGASQTTQTISVARPDGSSVVSGTRSNGLDPAHGTSPLATLYEVDSSAVVRSRAQYDDYFANATLRASATANNAAVPQLPIDGGLLNFTATGTMVINGTATMTAPEGGLAGLVSITSSDNIVINDTGSSGATPAANTLYLSAVGLSNLGAGSLLIGGTRIMTAAGLVVTATSSSVELANDASAPLFGPDITLVSAGSLVIGAGAVLEARGSLSGAADNLRIGTANVSGTGDGALVRVSSDPAATIFRDPTSVSIGGGVGSLVIGANARVHAATGTAILDSSNAVSFDSSAQITAVSLALGAGKISLQLTNAGALQPNAGLVLPGATLSGLQSAGGALALVSYSSIDVYGTGAVGSAELGSLAIHAAGIRGFNQGGGTVSFSAKTVTLDNSPSGQTVAAVAGANSVPSGTLAINGDTVTIGSNTLNIVGYSDVDLVAPKGVLVKGSGGLATVGNLTITSARVTGATGASQSLAAGGALTINGTADAAAVTGGLGASLVLTGSSINDTGILSLPSGTLTLHATSGDVILGNGGMLDVAGVAVAFFDQMKYSGGGQVVLKADAGSVRLQTNSTIDVSAPAAAGDAGRLSIGATLGTFTFDGTVRGNGGAGGKGGTFVLDVGQLAVNGGGAQSLAALNAATDGGGFTQLRSVRVRNGNVLVDGTAAAKNFYLAADSGAITVTGTIDASGTTGGAIALYAYNGVTLANGSKLTVAARKFDDAGKGGSVDIETGEAKSIGGVMTPGVGWIDIQTGSTIDLSVASGPGGTLHLRAPQVDGTNNPIAVNSTTSGIDLAIKPLNGTIINPTSIVAEGYAVFDLTSSGGVIDATIQNSVNANGQGFANAANSATIAGRLLGGTPNAGLSSVLHVQPGEEIVSLGAQSLTLNGQGSSLTIPTGTGVVFPSGTPIGDTVSFSVGGTIIAANGTVTHFAAGTPITVAAGSTVALDGAGSITFASGAAPISIALKGEGSSATSAGSSTTAAYASGTVLNLNGVGSSLVIPANTTVTFSDGLPAGDALAVASGTTFKTSSGGSLITLTTPGSGVTLGSATSIVLPAGDVMTSTGAFSTILNGSVVSLGVGKNISLPKNATVGFSFATGSSITNNINGATITTAAAGGTITLNASISSSVKVGDSQTKLSFPNGTPGTDKIRTSVAATIINPDGTTTSLAANTQTTLAAGSSLVLSGNVQGGTVTFATGSTAIPVTLGVGAYTLSNLTSITSLPANSTYSTGTTTGTLSAAGGAVSVSLGAGQYTTSGQITALAAGTTFLGGTVALASGSTPVSVSLPASTFTTTGTGVVVTALAAGTTATITAAGTFTLTGGGNAIPLSLAAGTFTVNGAASFGLAGDLVLASDWNLNGFRYGPGVTSVLGSGEPGTLTLRASGNLIFNAALSDGFGASPTDPSTHLAALWESPLLAPGSRSWSYRLAAGADFAGVDYHDVLSSIGTGGSVQIGKTGTGITSSTTATTASLLGTYYQVVRTGTGDIDIAAAKDVQLLNQFATIYTAGSQILPVLDNGDTHYAFDTPNTAYTASNSLGGPSPGPAYAAQYSSGGGNVTITAGRDIIHLTTGGADDSSQELPSNWLYRRDVVANGAYATTHNGDHGSATWWIDFSNFFEGVGALGGGNVSLTAGRDVKNVDAVVPTQAWSPYQTTTTSNGTIVNTRAADQPLFVFGGGDLSVRAGRDINGGVYYVEKGTGELAAGRDITTNTTRTAINPATVLLGGLASLTKYSTDPATWLPTTLFLGDGRFDVSAGRDVLLGSVANAFALPQGINNSYWDTTYFTTYSSTAAVDVSSLAGSVTVKGNNGLAGNLNAWIGAILAYGTPDYTLGAMSNTRPWLRLTVSTSGAGSSVQSIPGATSLVVLMPPTVRATAFSGDIGIVGNLTAMPSPTGTIDLEAAGSILGLQPVSGNQYVASSGATFANNGTATINLQDFNPDAIPSVQAPLVPTPATADIRSLLTQVNALVSGTIMTSGETTPLHANDPEPLRLYAKSGNVADLQLNAGKPVAVIAGTDITDINFNLQNNNAGDVSVIAAGRDIILYNPNNESRQAILSAATAAGVSAQQVRDWGLLPLALQGNVTIGGPGTLEVLAGRNLTLSSGAAASSNTIISTNTDSGIVSIGNANNPVLPFNQGAQIIAAAGLGVPTGMGLSGSKANIAAFIADFLDPATAGDNATRFLPELGNLLGMSGAGNQDIWDAFSSKSAEQKATIALDVFYRVLRDAGRDHNNGNLLGGYNVGYRAIADLFSGAGRTGNISLSSREIKTTSGGNIDLLAPGGNILVGFDLGEKQPLDQGILTLSTGNISVFAKGNVTVGTSRIFTFRGGNEIIWSTDGNIAAGAASKTLQSAPPTRFLIDPKTGAATLDVAGLATGGGIGVLQTVVGAPTGSVDLIAPNGFVDAGEAGIRVSGNLNIAAVQVLNAGNIQVGGTSSGVPTVQAPNIGGLTAAGNAAGAASKAADTAVPTNNQASGQPSILIVEIEGYGGGTGNQDATSPDQRKRQP